MILTLENFEFATHDIGFLLTPCPPLKKIESFGGQMDKPTCRLCNKKFSDRGLSRHLQSCLPKHMETGVKNPKEKTFHLHVSDTYNRVYFLHLAVAGTTTLNELDAFFRNIWVECCGHLSQFSYGRFGEEVKMNQSVFRVLNTGDQLYYQYDFGDTTELIVKAMGVYNGISQETEPIRLLVRNVQPDIPCDQCDAAPAEVICTQCQWNGDGWLCSKCAKDHRCDEEMFLKVVNSPRTGHCGYQ